MAANKAQMLAKQKMYDEILKYRELHPEVSYRNIGKLFNISGQRIHQILLLKGVISKTVDKQPLTQVDMGSTIKVA